MTVDNLGFGVPKNELMQAVMCRITGSAKNFKFI